MAPASSRSTYWISSGVALGAGQGRLFAPFEGEIVEGVLSAADAQKAFAEHLQITHTHLAGQPTGSDTPLRCTLVKALA